MSSIAAAATLKTAVSRAWGLTRILFLVLQHNSPLHSVPSLQRAVEHAAAPVRKGIVRVAHYEQRLVLRPTAHETQLYVRYFDNPGGALPAWLVKWAAASGAPKFLRAMDEAAAKYPAYAAQQGRS